MLTIVQIRYEENGAPAALLSVAINHVTRDDDAVVVVPVGNNISISSPFLGAYEADLTPFQLDASFNYTVHWTATTLGLVTRNPTTKIVASGLDTRASIRRRIGRIILGRDLFGYGPVTSATVNSVSTRFARRYPDEFYKGRDLYIVSGIGHGQDALISNSFQGTGQLQVSPGWETIPDTSSVVEVWSDRITIDDVNDAINMAIADISDVTRIREDRLIPAALLSTDRLSFPVPDDFTHVFQVESLDGTTWSAWDRTRGGAENLYQIRNRTVYLPTALSGSSDELWVRGYRKPRRLLTDQDICDVAADYVVYMSCFLLDASAAEGQSLDPEQHAGRAGNWYRQALLRRNEVLAAWEPNTQAVH